MIKDKQRGPLSGAKQSGKTTAHIEQIARTSVWVLERAKAAKLNQKTLAEKAGLSQGALSVSLRSPRGVTRETLTILADRFGWTVPADILAEADPGRRRGPVLEVRKQRSAAKDAARLVSAPSADQVSIFGAIFKGATPYFYVNPIPIDYAPRPLGIRATRGAFALRMPGDSMSPWRRHGEFVYFDPNRAVAAGDHTLAEFVDPQAPNDPPFCLIGRLDATFRPGEPLQLTLYGLRDTPADLKYFRATKVTAAIEWTELLFGAR